MAEQVTVDRGHVTFVEGAAKYGSNELLPPGLYILTVWRCPTSGYRIELEPGNAGINPTPGVLVLRPRITLPAHGEPVLDVITDVRVLTVDHGERPNAVWIQADGGTTLPVEAL